MPSVIGRSNEAACLGNSAGARIHSEDAFRWLQHCSDSGHSATEDWLGKNNLDARPGQKVLVTGKAGACVEPGNWVICGAFVASPQPTSAGLSVSMGLPNSYTQKTGALPDYFEAVLDAQPPERFSIKFLENLGFASTNDRLFVAVLKELGFLNSDGAPQQRYFDYLDRTKSSRVLAEGIREMYSDLFAVNKQANELSVDEVKNKLRTLYSGKKPDSALTSISKTFVGLCQLADFSVNPPEPKKTEETSEEQLPPKPTHDLGSTDRAVSLGSLQYHINIVLPDSRDQGVYDAIFKSLRDHLR